jgi:hypothetical protein
MWCALRCGQISCIFLRPTDRLYLFILQRAQSVRLLRTTKPRSVLCFATRPSGAQKTVVPWHIGVQGALLDYFCCDSGPPHEQLLGAVSTARAPPLELDVVLVAVVATMGNVVRVALRSIEVAFFLRPTASLFILFCKEHPECLPAPQNLGSVLCLRLRPSRENGGTVANRYSLRAAS